MENSIQIWVKLKVRFLLELQSNICSVRTASKENLKIDQISHFEAHFSLIQRQKVLHNLMSYKWERLKFFYQVGLDFRFDDKPEVDTGNHVAGVSRSLGI